MFHDFSCMEAVIPSFLYVSVFGVGFVSISTLVKVEGESVPH